MSIFGPHFIYACVDVLMCGYSKSIPWLILPLHAAPVISIWNLVWFLVLDTSVQSIDNMTEKDNIVSSFCGHRLGRARQIIKKDKCK